MLQSAFAVLYIQMQNYKIIWQLAEMYVLPIFVLLLKRNHRHAECKFDQQWSISAL